MRTDYLSEVVFDVSTNPGTVKLNGIYTLRFDSDADAQRVFELLCNQRDSNRTFRSLAEMRVADAINALSWFNLTGR